MTRNNLRDYGFVTNDDILNHIQDSINIGRTADWIGEHLISYDNRTDENENISGELPCLYLSTATPSIKNFLLLLWNRLFSYPHKLSHINVIVQGVANSNRRSKYDQCLNLAVRLFGNSSCNDAILQAHRFLRLTVDSSWDKSSRESLDFTESISSLVLEFKKNGEMTGGHFKIDWLNECDHLVDIYNTSNPTFKLLHNMASWISCNERDLDSSIFGKNINRRLQGLDIHGKYAEEFVFAITYLKTVLDHTEFIAVLQILSSIFHIQRVRTGLNQDGKINIYNPEGLTAFSDLLKIELKELRYAILAEVGKSKSDMKVLLGTKDPKQVNADIKALAVALYRGVVDFILSRINATISSSEKSATMQLFDTPNILESEDISFSDYDTLSKNIINDILEYSKIDSRSKEVHDLMEEDEIEMGVMGLPLPDDFMRFYVGQVKMPSFISFILQDKAKKNPRKIIKQIYNDMKGNKRVFKPNAKSERKDCIVGLQHSNEHVFWYNLNLVIDDAHSVLPIGFSKTFSTSSNPVIIEWKNNIHTTRSLDLLVKKMMEFSSQISSERSLWFFDIRSIKSHFPDKQTIISCHLLDLIPRRHIDYSEVLTHRIVLERYHSIVHNYDGKILPSVESTSSTFQRLSVKALIGREHAYITPGAFCSLEKRVSLYDLSVMACQRIIRGFLARRLLKSRKAEAQVYRNKICNTLNNMKALQTLFTNIQTDLTKSVIVECDTKEIIKFMKNGELEREKTKIQNPWGILYFVSQDRILCHLDLIFDFYWIFGSDDYSSSKPYQIKLRDHVEYEDSEIVNVLDAGFYLSKNSNGNISIKRKSRQPIRVWGGDVDYRHSISEDVNSDGILPLNESINVFDNQLFCTRIANAIHSKRVCSKAIETESVIPLVFGSEVHFSSLCESKLYCIIVDYSIRDSLRHDNFNKKVRQEVETLMKRGFGNSRKQFGEVFGKKSRKVFSDEASLHSLLIRMDTEIQKQINIDDEVEHRRRKAKWSKIEFNERQLRNKFE